MNRLFGNKKGFGITEVLIAAVVLGLMYMAILHMQTGNRETLIRIRGRDGAIEVAQQVLDSLKRVGVAAIPSKSDTTFVFTVDTISRSWGRGENVGGGSSVIKYVPVVTVSPTSDYEAKNESEYETVSHIYAKQVNVEVTWMFKGSPQSINVSSVVR